ncbi:alpha/beta hydrolase family protein [Streptomyces mirabilis]|uniref:alpha/beta hydrolase family protein n=1 Tax=Streptomyces mirabilis TaxID=68239 RepID=UPI0033DC5DD9
MSQQDDDERQHVFEPFPHKYVWNLSVGLALAVGGQIGEVDRACQALRGRIGGDDDSAAQAFFEEWCALGDRLTRLARADVDASRLRSAGLKFGRAAAYYQTAERMQSRSYAPRQAAYAKALESFHLFLKLSGEPGQRVEIPYGDSSLPGILVRPETTAAVPCVIFWNGLDSTKEQIYGTGTAQELARRGIASLIVDTPGAGEALRLRDLRATVDTEVWAAACVDYLETRTDINSDCVGLVAWSLGGYYGPRATAFESRIAFGVAWGSNYDWGAVQEARLKNEGDRPVPHYWEHVQWVWGRDSLEEFMEIAPSITLRGIVDRIRVPFLVVHGEHDRQIPVTYAHRLYDELTNSPAPELKIFTDEEGGVEHCSVDNIPVVRDFICDWIDRTVTDLTGRAGSEDRQVELLAKNIRTSI